MKSPSHRSQAVGSRQRTVRACRHGVASGVNTYPFESQINSPRRIAAYGDVLNGDTDKPSDMRFDGRHAA